MIFKPEIKLKNKTYIVAYGTSKKDYWYTKLFTKEAENLTWVAGHFTYTFLALRLDYVLYLYC
ncbi:hypothetical protein JZU46_00955 [bacterium]|nr:hypothetical protein [bacterium]